MKFSRFCLILLVIAKVSLAGDFARVDSLMNSSISAKLFPAAQVLAGNKSKILFEKAYGRFTYEAGSPKTELNSMFDMASCTKAFATNLVMMRLYDKGKFKLEDRVSKYLPEFAQNGKENVRIIDLLIHESGLQAYLTPKAGQTRNELLKAIMALPLEYKTNSRMTYSCLNFVTLMLVSEKISGMPLYKYYQKYFTDPMGLRRCKFLPEESLKNECVPTTPQFQGVVHDPLARALEGRSGNAGLFASAGDLSKICKMLLCNGELNGRRYLTKKTVALFTKRYSKISSRAIGFDTRSDSGYCSSGKYFSKGTFGHLGFTGTSIWIDPVKSIYVIFLSNRVYPDEKASLSETRPMLHNRLLEALGEAK